MDAMKRRGKILPACSVLEKFLEEQAVSWLVYLAG